MRVHVRRAGSAVIVDLDGLLVLGVGDELLRDVIDELLAEGWRTIVLNLDDVDRVDSAGIGELVASSRLATRFESAVKLVNARGQVRRVLEASHVLPLIEVFDCEAAALSSISRPDSVADP